MLRSGYNHDDCDLECQGLSLSCVMYIPLHGKFFSAVGGTFSLYCTTFLAVFSCFLEKQWKSVTHATHAGIASLLPDLQPSAIVYLLQVYMN